MCSILALLCPYPTLLYVDVVCECCVACAGVQGRGGRAGWGGVNFNLVDGAAGGRLISSLISTWISREKQHDT